MAFGSPPGPVSIFRLVHAASLAVYIVAITSSGVREWLDRWAPAASWAVAIGTILLAGATAYLAKQAKREASAVREDAEAVRDSVALQQKQLDVSAAQVAVSQESIAGSVRPVLVGVPRGRFPIEDGERVDVPGRSDQRGINDAGEVLYEYVDGFLFVSVAFRNAGAGIAFLHSGVLVAPEVESAGELTTSALPLGEIVRASFGFDPGERVPSRQAEMFSVIVRYSDLAGAVWATRLEFNSVQRQWRTGELLITSEGRTNEVGRLGAQFDRRQRGDPPPP